LRLARRPKINYRVSLFLFMLCQTKLEDIITHNIIAVSTKWLYLQSPHENGGRLTQSHLTEVVMHSATELNCVLYHSFSHLVCYRLC